MLNDRTRLKDFLLGIVSVLAFIAIIGAVDHSSPNKAGDTTTSFNSVFASSDGKTVYVCDNSTVYRSDDSGANWVVVLKKTNNLPL